MCVSRLPKTPFLNAVFLAIALPCTISWPLEAVPRDGGHLKSEIQRREHLRASLCASFYLQERGQRLPQNPEVRKERCGPTAPKRHASAEEVTVYGPIITRSTFREARSTYSVSSPHSMAYKMCSAVDLSNSQ